jgi:hypothetical protein
MPAIGSSSGGLIFTTSHGGFIDPRNAFWAPHQWPLERFVQPPEDKELVCENKPMIELIWNLWQVQLPGLVEADLSQSPRYWYRIEDAVSGYAELVRRRESGKRELIEGPRDRKQTEQAQKMLKHFGLGAERRAAKGLGRHPVPTPCPTICPQSGDLPSSV